MINFPFPIPIAFYDNIDLVDNLRSYIISMDEDGIKSNVAPTVKHNLSESEFNFFDTHEPCVVNLKNWIAGRLGDTVNQLNETRENFDIIFRDSWYHVTKKYGAHDYHIHPNCSWCGIYYLDDIDESVGGLTRFFCPFDFGYLDVGNKKISDTSFSVTPRKGLLCLFPSFLGHTQQLYTGDKDRVVVAFNSCIQSP